MTLRFAAAGAVLAFAASIAAVIAGVSSASSFLIVGIDVEVSDNSPRSLIDFDDCVSISQGETVEIDVAVSQPGIPDDRGLAGYQFRLFYDSTILRVIGDDGEQLLDQAPGSNVIPLTDPKPDADGAYLSTGVDFGAAGIEPDGTSETGAGVVARVTLEAHGTGTSGLVLQDVLLKDDSAQNIEIDSIQTARVHVGEPCPGLADTPSPTPKPAATFTPSPTSVGGEGGGGAPAGGGNVPAPSTGAPSEIVTAGGPPAPAAGVSAGALLGGLLLTLTGALLGMGSLSRGHPNKPALEAEQFREK